MTGRRVLLLGTLLVASFLFSAQRGADAESLGGTIVRIAELEIDPAQLDAYKLALKEEIETSIWLEPGVLTLYAVSLKERPEQIRLFETYRDAVAYESHLQSPHFKTYKSRTQQMVKSLRLVETEPILPWLKIEMNFRPGPPKGTSTSVSEWERTTCRGQWSGR